MDVDSVTGRERRWLPLDHEQIAESVALARVSSATASTTMSSVVQANVDEVALPLLHEVARSTERPVPHSRHQP